MDDIRRRRQKFLFMIVGGVILMICTLGMICMTLQEWVSSLNLY